MKVKTSKGFTLAELLIVMAIIVVLSAIAIPTFGKQLETARETNDAENIRVALTDAFTKAYVDYANDLKFTHDDADGANATGAYTITDIAVTQKTAGFEYINPKFNVGTGGTEQTISETTYKIGTDAKIDVTFTFTAGGAGKESEITLSGVTAAKAASLS